MRAPRQTLNEAAGSGDFVFCTYTPTTMSNTDSIPVTFTWLTTEPTAVAIAGEWDPQNHVSMNRQSDGTFHAEVRAHRRTG